LQPHTTDRAFGVGLEAGEIRRPQQPGVGIAEGGEHRLDRRVGVFAAMDRFLEGFLAQPPPIHRLKTLRIDVALVHQAPALHHQLLGIVEGPAGGGLAQQQHQGQNPSQPAAPRAALAKPGGQASGPPQPLLPAWNQART
jgi:hypothetical protein